MPLLMTKPVLNRELTRGDRQVWLIDVLPIAQGQTFCLEFLGADGDWRQGVWLATEGELEAQGAATSQFVLWEDTAPEVVEVRVNATDGLLRLYNIWDSGRGLGRYEAQSATAGMVKRVRDDGAYVYACNDIGSDPDFTKLRFAVTALKCP
jgi:hypothetical protein